MAAASAPARPEVQPEPARPGVQPEPARLGVQPEPGRLVLEAEAKLAVLLPPAAGQRLEASGVLAGAGCFYVVFDNGPDIARVGTGLAARDDGNALIRQDRGRRAGFEDIAHDPVTGRYYVLVEAHARGEEFMAEVQEYDRDFAYLGRAWLDFPLDGPNKGLEGLTCVHRHGRSWLLGLCEGNRCRDGAEGRRPGGGRIQVFERGRRQWDRAATIRLPATLSFQDFSSLAVAGDRLAVLSQESSALWVGRLRPSAWEVADDGEVWRFPPDPRGRTVYCNVEGVSWIAPDRVVVVSDRAKRDGRQDDRCRAKDQSIHVFTIPAPDPG
jgi:hypothetical protein